MTRLGERKVHRIGAMDRERPCLAEGLGVQVNVTISNKNRQDIDSVLGMVGKLGIGDVHMFFLVPTGRGRTEDKSSQWGTRSSSGRSSAEENGPRDKAHMCPAVHEDS